MRAVFQRVRRRSSLSDMVPCVKSLVRLIALAALVIVVAALANTFRRTAAPRGGGAPPPAETPGDIVDESVVAEHLSAAIKFRTVSHQDPRDDDRALFAAFRAYLEATYPKMHAAMSHELVNGDGLLYRWEGSNPSAPPILR